MYSTVPTVYKIKIRNISYIYITVILRKRTEHHRPIISLNRMQIRSPFSFRKMCSGKHLFSVIFCNLTWK